MKKGLQKIVVPTLAICLGAALAGSISGTVAWYQYSTRASAAYLGTSAGTAGNLKLRIKGTNTATDDKWSNGLSKDAIKGYLEDKGLGQDIIPITAGNIGEDSALNKIGGTGADKDLPKFFKNPIRSFDQTVPYNGGSWLKADQTMYVQIPLEVAFIEYDGEKPEGSNVDKEYLEKEVYISDLLIQEDYQNTSGDNNFKDLSSAVRVHISSYRDDDTSEGHVDTAFDRLISKDGGSILTEGYLDLDGDGELDSVTTGTDAGAKYGFGSGNQTKNVVYGEGSQKAYKAATEGDTAHKYKNLANEDVADPIYPAVTKSVGNSVVLDEEDFEFSKVGTEAKTSKSIGKTIGYDALDDNFEQEFLNVTLTIWLEGWQPLVNAEDNPDTTDVDESDISPIWESSSFIGSMFDVGIQFAVQAE